MQTLESRLMQTGLFNANEGGCIQRVEEIFSDFLTAQHLAELIDSKSVQVEDIYEQILSYEEDFRLFGLPPGNWNAILPDYENIAIMIASLLSIRDAEQLLEVVKNSYTKAKRNLGSNSYNPFESDYELGFDMLRANKDLQQKHTKRLLENLNQAHKKDHWIHLLRLVGYKDPKVIDCIPGWDKEARVASIQYLLDAGMQPYMICRTLADMLPKAPEYRLEAFHARTKTPTPMQRGDEALSVLRELERSFGMHDEGYQIRHKMWWHFFKKRLKYADYPISNVSRNYIHSCLAQNDAKTRALHFYYKPRGRKRVV
ncbi:hypothetical protein GF323_05045 [Candidatus Woesearchaeota archaeon]|nr:hypothetical protein [Candidatus Woesearchaeota archaeon]